MAQSMMKPVSLPFPILVGMPAAEFPFPKCEPLFNREPQITGRTEQVKVIGHKQIVTDQPGVCSAPDFFEGYLHGAPADPRHAVFRAYSQEYDRWFREGDFYAFGSGDLRPGIGSSGMRSCMTRNDIGTGAKSQTNTGGKFGTRWNASLPWYNKKAALSGGL